jgi:hypothetical protein
MGFVLQKAKVPSPKLLNQILLNGSESDLLRSHEQTVRALRYRSHLLAAKPRDRSATLDPEASPHETNIAGHLNRRTRCRSCGPFSNHQVDILISAQFSAISTPSGTTLNQRTPSAGPSHKEPSMQILDFLFRVILIATKERHEHLPSHSIRRIVCRIGRAPRQAEVHSAPASRRTFPSRVSSIALSP